MLLSDFLKGVKAKIDTPEKWCKQNMCVKSDGRLAKLWDEDVAKCCIVGSMMIRRGELAGDWKLPFPSWLNDLYSQAKEALTDHTNGQALPSFNDEHTHAEVMEVFTKAIRDAMVDEMLDYEH